MSRSARACARGRPGIGASSAKKKQGAPARARALPGSRPPPLAAAGGHTHTHTPPSSSHHAPARPPPTLSRSFAQSACACEDRWIPPPGAPAPPGGAAATVPYPADLAWTGLTAIVPDRAGGTPKTILAPTAGIVVPGELCALVGPSGAGKSTLLELLAGYAGQDARAASGTIAMNGAPIGRRFRRVSAMVNQDDLFVPTMTALETLTFHANLRIPRASGAAAAATKNAASAGSASASAALTKDEMDGRMQSVLETMGLWRARHTQVGGTLAGGVSVRGLSGGEKRRLTIACSLIARPSILFLDEPTSGLDSFAALNIMEYVAKLGGAGHTIIASVHQPRAAIWAMFHKVCLLSEGRQLYFGPPGGVAPWFGERAGFRYAPRRDGAVSDWIIDLVSVGFAKPPAVAARSMTGVADVTAAAAKWADAGVPAQLGAGDAAAIAGLASATEAGTLPPADDGLGLTAAAGAGAGADGKALVARQRASRVSRYPTSWLTQFRVLLHRSWVNQVRNPADATSRLMLAVWVSMMAGLVAFDQELNPSNAGKTIGTFFFEVIVFSLLPFCYMSLYMNDRAYFVSDVRSGLYAPSAYHIALTLSSLPFIIAFSVLGGFVTYGAIGMWPSASHIAMFGLLMTLNSLCAIQVLVAFVYGSDTQDMAYINAVGYSSLGVLLMGFWVRIQHIRLPPLRWLSYIFYQRWALQGFSHNELSGRKFYYPSNCKQWDSNPALYAAAKEAWPKDPRNNPFNIPVARLSERQRTPTCSELNSGDDILRFWGFTITAWQSVGLMLLFYGLFHVASFLALRSLVKRRG